MDPDHPSIWQRSTGQDGLPRDLARLALYTTSSPPGKAGQRQHSARSSSPAIFALEAKFAIASLRGFLPFEPPARARQGSVILLCKSWSPGKRMHSVHEIFPYCFNIVAIWSSRGCTAFVSCVPRHARQNLGRPVLVYLRSLPRKIPCLGVQRPLQPKTRFRSKVSPQNTDHLFFRRSVSNCGDYSSSRRSALTVVTLSFPGRSPPRVIKHPCVFADARRS